MYAASKLDVTHAVPGGRGHDDGAATRVSVRPIPAGDGTILRRVPRGDGQQRKQPAKFNVLPHIPHKVSTRVKHYGKCNE